MGTVILKRDRDQKPLNDDVTSAYPVDLKSGEPVQKHVNKCEQRIIPELNGIILLELRHEWHTTVVYVCMLLWEMTQPTTKQQHVYCPRVQPEAS